MAVQVQLRRGTPQEWTDADPILAAGEMGVEENEPTSQNRFKIGDGIKTWSNLEYFTQGGTGPVGPAGPQGEKGDTGDKGDKGDTPAHEWQGTELRFENPDGSWGPYVDLEGPQGIQGETGEKGDKPAHEWFGSQLRFENPDGSWGQYTDLLGPVGPAGPQGQKGDTGDQGPAGPQGLQGDTGPAGPQGEKGDTGDQGPAGNDGEVQEAPIDGQQYARQNGAWSVVSGGGGSTVTTGPTFPLAPSEGNLHYMTANPVGLYIYYNDGSSSQWVQTNAGGGDGGAGAGDPLSLVGIFPDASGLPQYPLDVQAGDLLVGGFTSNDDGNVLETPTTWTKIETSYYNGASDLDTISHLYYRIADGTESGTIEGFTNSNGRDQIIYQFRPLTGQDVSVTILDTGVDQTPSDPITIDATSDNRIETFVFYLARSFTTNIASSVDQPTDDEQIIAGDTYTAFLKDPAADPTMTLTAGNYVSSLGASIMIGAL